MKRVPILGSGLSRSVVHNGLVYVVATDPLCSDGITAQTRNTLQQLEEVLVAAGSDKTRILQATVYLQDVRQKPEMNVEWLAWIGPEENWPQRACVGVDLDEGWLIEIVVTAAVL